MIWEFIYILIKFRFDIIIIEVLYEARPSFRHWTTLRRNIQGLIGKIFLPTNIQEEEIVPAQNMSISENR